MTGMSFGKGLMRGGGGCRGGRRVGGRGEGKG